jgi:long-chain fatty acid transport protein
MSRAHWLVFLASSVTFFLSPDDARASGFFVSQIGGPDASPTDPDPTAVFWNPAALGGIDGLVVQGDLNSILRFARYDRRVAYQWNPQDRNWDQVAGTEQSASLFNYIPLPFFGAAYRIGRWLSVGLGAYSCFGSSSTWDDAEGPQAYHSVAGSNQSVFFSSAVALRVLSWLHAGVTLSYVRSSASSERLAEFSDIVGGLPEDPSLKATMELAGFAGNAFSAEVGLYADLDRLRVGVAYQPPIAIVNQGRIVLTPHGDKIKDVIGDRPAEADAEMRYTLPDNVKASVDYFLRRDLRLRLYLEWVNWSRFDAIRIDVQRRTISLLPESIVDEQRFEDAFGGTVQAKYWLRPGLALFAGIGFDTGAIPDETHSAVFIDSEKIAAHAGIDLSLLDSVRAKLGLKYVHLFENEVEGSTRAPTADGSYGGEFLMIDLNLSFLALRKGGER